MEATKMKVLWMINERGDRSYWTRVGVGHVNRDGSINISLDAIPVGNGKLQLRDYAPRDAEPEPSPHQPEPSPSEPAYQPAARASRRARTEAAMEPGT